MGARTNSKSIAIAAGAPPGDWRRRLRSPEFRRALEELVRAEVAEAAALPVRELVDAGAIRAALGGVDPAVPRPAAVAQVAVRINERIEKRLRKERRSVDEMLSGDVRDELDALLDEELPNPEALEEILAQIIRQKFVRKLFAELIHSAILAFNKRVNPFFGGITASMLDAQIKSFIELGMPMLQEQAVAFVLRPANQQFAIDLARSLIRGALAEPLGDLVPRASAAQRRRLERLIARALESERLGTAVPAAAQQLWDDLYAQIRDKKLGQLVDAERLADALVEPVTELAVAALSRPRIAAFLAATLTGRA
jgi:hypothetical protein